MHSYKYRMTKRSSFRDRLFHLAALRHHHLFPSGFLWIEADFEGRYLRNILRSITGSFVYKADGTALSKNVWQVCDMIVYIGTALRLCYVDIQSPFLINIWKVLKIAGSVVLIWKSSFVFFYKFNTKNFYPEKNLVSLSPVTLFKKYMLRHTWMSSSEEHIIIIIIINIIIIIINHQIKLLHGAESFLRS